MTPATTSVDESVSVCCLNCASECLVSGVGGPGGSGWRAPDGEFYCRVCWVSWGVEHDPDQDYCKVLVPGRECSSEKPLPFSEKNSELRSLLDNDRNVDDPSPPPPPSDGLIDADHRTSPELTRSVYYCDAHCHLDYVLLNEKYGFMKWQIKTRICHWWAQGCDCPYKSCCDYAHGRDELSQRASLAEKDFEPFALRHCVVRPHGADRKSRVRYCLGCIIHNCCDLEAIADTQMLVSKASQTVLAGKVFCTFGCHPMNWDNYDDAFEARLLEGFEACGDRAVAWGECGLDYAKSWDAEHSELRKQMKAVFARQARLAVSRKLPLVVHTREADADTLEVLRDNVPREHPVHIHAYQGSLELLNWCLDEMPNSIIGTSSLIFISSSNAMEIARLCPLHRLVLETDAPYLNDEPRDVLSLASRIGELKGVSADQLLRVTSENCMRFYGIDLATGAGKELDTAKSQSPAWHAAVDWDRESRIRRKQKERS